MVNWPESPGLKRHGNQSAQIVTAARNLWKCNTFVDYCDWGIYRVALLQSALQFTLGAADADSVARGRFAAVCPRRRFGIGLPHQIMKSLGGR